MNTVAKMALLAAFILRPCHWDAQAAAWAKQLPHDSPEDYGALFTEKVRSGQSLAFEVVAVDSAAPKVASIDGRVALLVCHVDRSYNMGELVIEAAFCPDNRRGLTAAFLPQIEAKAIELGCATVRFHTMRAGLIQTAVSSGYRVCEVICRKDVRHA